jgi:hypothetical protein
MEVGQGPNWAVEPKKKTQFSHDDISLPLFVRIAKHTMTQMAFKHYF